MENPNQWQFRMRAAGFSAADIARGEAAGLAVMERAWTEAMRSALVACCGDNDAPAGLHFELVPPKH